MRIRVHGNPLLQGQTLDHGPSLHVDIAHEQGECGGEHGGIGSSLGRVNLDLHAILGGDERRIGLDLVAVDDGGDGLLHGAEGLRVPFLYGLGLGRAAHAGHGGLDGTGLALDEGG